jgi:hypothetical protein
VAFSPWPNRAEGCRCPAAGRWGPSLPAASRAVPSRCSPASALPCLIDQTALREPAGMRGRHRPRQSASPTSPVPPNSLRRRRGWLPPAALPERASDRVVASWSVVVGVVTNYSYRIRLDATGKLPCQTSGRPNFGDQIGRSRISRLLVEK